MIWLYSGTPGSGKSYHAVQDIWHRVNKKKGYQRVIANFPLTVSSDQFHYFDTSDMTVENFIRFSKKHHAPYAEGQTLVVIDEAQIIFNSRSWNTDGNSRLDWIKFFSQHRKLGFNFILIAQFDRMLDRQIRCLVEYEIAHLKVNNYFRILPITTFVAVQRWYGQRLKIGQEFLIYRKKIAGLYDTYKMFDNEDTVPVQELNSPVEGAGIQGTRD